MRQLEIENQLRDVVSRIMLQVELATAQGRTDINLALEDAFIPILKSVYNLPHLVNLNRKQKNFPGIDLGDDHDRVAFQLTSTTTLEKVKFTVRQFMERAYYNTFDELYVLMLARKQSSYSQASVNELLGDKLAFNCKKHIIDLTDLLGEVSGLRLAAQERVLAEFKHILGEVDAFISYSTETVAAPMAITSNLQAIRLPEAVHVAELEIDDKDVLSRARTELSYGGKARSRRSIVKMALLLNGVETDAWICHENKLFSFHDLEATGLASIVQVGNRTIPWRLVEDNAKLRSCYIGVGFYKSRDGETVSSSLAQVFDEFGHGIILRGTPVSIDKKNRHPYLSEDQAYELLRDALDEYDRALEHMPARIVIHKSSHFRDSERAGFLRALDEKGIRSKDFVSITDTDIRLFGDKDYPPKRGTLLSVSESEGVLYTRGMVDFYKTYPGMYVPNPLRITAYEQDSSLEALCEEILGLTKMNWNNTQLDGRLPITLECARKIGDIMKYVSATEKPQVSYSYYM